MKAPIRPLLLSLTMCVSFSASSIAFAAEDTSRTWHRLVGLLQYLEADYPAAVESQSRFELDEQSSFMAEAVEAAKELGPSGHVFVAKLTDIQKRVDQGVDPAGVSEDCGKLVTDLVLAGGLLRSPRHVPNLEAATKDYAVSCAACHAADGSSRVAIAEQMEPKPADFLSEGRMNALTPYKAFNTLSFGVTGTAMPGFSTLTEDQRWSLAFFVFTLRQPPCDHTPPRVSLEQLANSTDADLVAKYGQKELACLRRNLSEPDSAQALMVARNGVAQALELAAEGNVAAAQKALVDAYLLGMEPVEPVLRARSPELVIRIEEAFLAARVAAERGSPHLQDEGRELLALLDTARRGEVAAPTFWSVFWVAVLILLREGFEATIVIAALLAVLKKMKAFDQARVVHAGWVSALVVGAVAFFFGQKLLAGANREWVEGIAALTAVAMLLYAALWLNAKANIRKFMGELRERMQGALGRGSVIGLFAISFSAMFRESFETALFLQGLAIDSGSGAVWGAVAGLAVLLCLVLFISRYGYRLPMKTLFNASTVLLVATAVVLLGKGLHAMQEVGVLPLRPVGHFRVDVLGIYADTVSLMPQIALALAPVLYFFFRRRAENTLTPADDTQRLGAK